MAHWSSCSQSTCNLPIHHNLRAKSACLVLPVNRSRYWQSDCTTWQQCLSWDEPIHWRCNSENLNLTGLSHYNPTSKIQEIKRYVCQEKVSSVPLYSIVGRGATKHSTLKKKNPAIEKDHLEIIPFDWNLLHPQQGKLFLHHGQRHWGNTARSCTCNIKNRYMNVHVDTGTQLVESCVQHHLTCRY